MGLMIFNLIVSVAPVSAWAALLYWFSAQPALPGPPLPISDKVLHFAAYFVLGAALAWAGRNARGRSLHVALITAGVLYALSDEWHQSFVPGRDPSAGDFVADVVGLGLAYGLALLVLLRRQAHASRTSHHPPAIE